ncbi:MAG: hypothetical protein IPF92_06455 [Myxococcales bacterium]|nr:hypothetical protein [Myxococcales bacterium]
MSLARAQGRLGWLLGVGAACASGLVALGAGCASFGQADPPAVDASTDASAAVPSPLLDAGDAAPLPPGPIVFVSPRGDDTAHGRAPDAPLKTLGAALALAASQGLGEIRACKGRYGEPVGLKIARRVTLRGGYDCATFERPAGSPNARAEASADPVETVLFKATDDGATATLRFVEGSDGALLEGLTVEAATVNRSSTAIFVGPKARTELADVRLVLGGGEGPQVFGVGLDVSGGAVVVRRSSFRGTIGKNPSGTAANLAYLLNAGESSFIDNVFDPGGVSGIRGAVHLTVTADSVTPGAPVKIERNLFLGGAPKSLGGTTDPLLLAVNLTGPVAASLAENTVRFGRHVCERGCVVLGVASSGGATVGLRRNLIDLGELTADPGMAVTQRAIVAGGGGFVAENNVILLGMEETKAILQATGLEANTGCNPGPVCVIPDGPEIVFRHNTVHTGPVVVAPSLALGANVHAKHVTLDRNLFVHPGSGGSENGTTGVRIYSRDGASLMMTGNVLATPTVIAEVADFEKADTPPTIALFSAYSTAADANVRVPYLALAAQKADPAAWRADLTALDLPALPACAIVKRAPTGASPSVDFLGRPRASELSVGAFQAPAGAPQTCAQ